MLKNIIAGTKYISMYRKEKQHYFTVGSHVYPQHCHIILKYASSLTTKFLKKSIVSSFKYWHIISCLNILLSLKSRCFRNLYRRNFKFWCTILPKVLEENSNMFFRKLVLSVSLSFDAILINISFSKMPYYALCALYNTLQCCKYNANIALCYFSDK